MRLTAQKIPELEDDFVDIKYRELTPEIDRILRICEGARSMILCEKGGAVHNIDLHDIFYIEWVDDKSCVCTKDDVFTMASSLATLEDSLRKRQFIRVSRTCLCNLFKIKSVSTGINMRLTAEMINGERVVVNRRYRDGLLSAIHELATEVDRN